MVSCFSPWCANINIGFAWVGLNDVVCAILTSGYRVLLSIAIQSLKFTAICSRALLHHATCVATCFAILLRHKLQAHLQGVTCLAIIKSRNIFVARSIARSRIRFYFAQRLPHCNAFFRHCTV